MATNLEHEKPESDVQRTAKKVKLDDDAVSVDSNTVVETKAESVDSTAESEQQKGSDDDASVETADEEDASTTTEESKPASSGFASFSSSSGFASFQNTASSGFAAFAQTATSTSTGFGAFAQTASSSSTGFGATASSSADFEGFGKTFEKKTETTGVAALADAELANGEEDETILVEKRAKLFKFVDSDYSEVGVGPFRVLKPKDAQDDDAAKASARMVMRRESHPHGPGTKLLLNARLSACLSCVKKAEKALMLVIAETDEADKIKPTTFLLRFASQEDLLALQDAVKALLPAHATTS
ncbi:hypothetical protein Poli38472_004725 [Pythium oligandrum]|uniref:RanBD1 domain-containing protein n=1 Tax=Pythium oligandrum TaxID=41045 RepID=A0A8K1FEP6_PYTOL|nr:hypothetical protein Poli38472_004725 [Pythium oligandrum]|eukprot:TMW59656.1 hypothetical protein Poli38472_004725 [Pythium oligandrum]